MGVHLYGDPRGFANSAAPVLRRDPYSTNVIGVHLASVLAGIRAVGTHDRWAVVDDEAGDPVGVAMHTPPHHLFVSRMPPGAARELAETASSLGTPLGGVSGEKTAARLFAESWSALTGVTAAIQVTMRFYRLGMLVPPSNVPGTARLAGPGDLELVKSFLAEFHDEAQPQKVLPPGDLDTLATRRLETGQLWCWTDDGEIRSLAGVSDCASGVARIGPVYTPVQHRRRGYGAAVTAAATAAALDAGAKEVALYTDLANPISNSIYQAIGYLADHDAAEWGFDASSST
jgi:predicted GNAT family acetyltransferase